MKRWLQAWIRALSLAFLIAAIANAQDASATGGSVPDQSQLKEMLAILETMIAENDARLLTLQDRIELTTDMDEQTRLEEAASRWTDVLDQLDAQKSQVSDLLNRLPESNNHDN